MAGAAGRRSGPSLGLSGADRFYSARLWQLARLELPERQAEDLWRRVARHRRHLLRVLGRDVGQRVALLDYTLNVQAAQQDDVPNISAPQIIDKAALETIEHQAFADGLTGLQNRRYFEDSLAREVERSRRYGSPLSLMLLDLDQFKDVNDSYGHPMGDEVLRTVGALILSHVRAADVACRFGGDEFAVILPDTPLSDAFQAAERIRVDVAATFTRHAVCGEVTASAGLAMLAGSASKEQLLDQADRALYTAKRAGGNRVATTTLQSPSTTTDQPA